MANFQSIIKAELDPSRPVQEICAVMTAMVSAQREHEEPILLGVRDAIDRRLKQLAKGEEQHEPVLQPDSVEENK